MGGGNKIRTSDPKVENLRINTSAYGQPIPLIWGKTRVGGQVIDYIDFNPIAHVTETDAGGGKGGGSSKQEHTSYTYKVAVDILTCEGPVNAITNVWVGKEKKSLDDAQLALFIGKPIQSSWSYMQTKHPERALNYPGIAHVAGVFDLGSDASLPNFSFEADSGKGISSSILDSNPKRILLEFLTDPLYGVGFPAEYLDSWDMFDDFCHAYGIFLSPALTEQVEAQEFMHEIAEATNSQLLWSQGLIKIIPYCDEAATKNGRTYTPVNAPLYDLTDDDFLDDGDGEPVIFRRNSAADAFNSVQVEYYNRANEYNAEIVEARDQADVEEKGLRPCDPIKMHSICDASVGRAVAQTLLQRKLYVRNQYEFRLSWRFCLLEPMDLVTLTDAKLGLNRMVVRILTKEEDEYGTLTFTAEECPAGIYGLTVYSSEQADRATIDYNADPGDTLRPVIFEPPAELVDNGLEMWMALSGNSKMWGGAVIYVSYDNETYTVIGTVKTRSRYGTLTTELLAGARLDTMNQFAVDLSKCNGVLQSVSQGEFESNRALCYVDGEFISFRDTELVGENRYQIRLMNRGLYNSAITDHKAGSDFVRIDKAIFNYPYHKEDLGKTIYLKFASFNVLNGVVQDLAEVEPFIHTVQGKGGSELSVPFTITQSGLSLICEVTKNLTDQKGLNFYTYELRQGSAWDSSSLVGAFSGNKYSFDARDEGTITYWLKAIDSYGNYSKVATRYIVNVVGLPKRNIFLERTEDINTWFGNNMYLDDQGWHLKSVRSMGNYSKFADVFGKPLVRRSDATLLLPIVDLGANILDETAFYFDRDGNAKLRTVEVVGDFATFGEIFDAPVHYVPPKYAVETFVGIDINYNNGEGVRVDSEYRTSLDGVTWSGWTSSETKQFYGRYLQIRLLPLAMDGIASVILKGAKLVIDVPDVEDNIVNVPIPAGKKRISFNKKFTIIPSVGAFTQDSSGQSVTWRISNVTPQFFDIELLDSGGNIISGKLIQAIIRGY